MKRSPEEIERIIKEAESIGIANYYKVRNLRIRTDYKQLRLEGKSYWDAIYILVEKYNLADWSIQKYIGKKAGHGKDDKGKQKR